jgi:hypothetical protein
MQPRNLLFAFLLLFVLHGALRAQNPATPDLSGTWKLKPGKKQTPQALKSSVSDNRYHLLRAGHSNALHCRRPGINSDLYRRRE